ncbi:sugar dehydrogenase complex small subunit [Swingsia samuiensis]|uniref:Dehydrogenase n=1 Tax=Swingsia samuiensis TaxID=1293412 RepID=A0A4Y6UI89_9PROT|nr:sugar dehydrogenase complex small subunit [Swingsia samuiensis]QDH16764.1 dehydrogenase [Swingsia samuiensis]
MAGRPSFLMTRRRFALMTGAAIVSGHLSGYAQAQTPEEIAVSDETVASFMALSRFVTGHNHLENETGIALANGLSKQDPHFAMHVEDLNKRIITEKYSDIDAMADALRDDPLHSFILRIVRAWYAGILEDGTNAQVYTFEKALMYQVSRDNIPVPTYAHNGPNYWLADPNPVSALPIF